MFRVKLSKISTGPNGYCVYLDREKKYYFSNRRKAQDFLRYLSKRFTEALVFINEEYCQVYNMYRQYFFILEDFEVRYQIENSLSYIKDKVTLLLFRNGSENYNSHVTVGIENMLFELKLVYSKLNDVSISKGDTTIRHKIGMKSHILDLYLNDFRDFEIEIQIDRTEIKVIKLNRFDIKKIV